MQAYHEPDDRWTMFDGVTDFESYCNLFLIKGKFHPLVHEDVVKAFETVEYLLAHAWYHWQMYDEAAVKAALIVEMAVRKKCAAWGFPLKFETKKKEARSKHLSELMNDLCKKEPLKNLDWHFENTRKIRNSIAHPGQHSFMGPVAKGFIVRTINLLNRIFLPENYFTECNEQLTRVQQQALAYKNVPVLLEYADKWCLTEILEIVAAAKTGDGWFYYITLHPVVANIAESIELHCYAPAHDFFVSGLCFEDGAVSAIETNTLHMVRISISQHPENIAVFQKYQKEREDAENSNKLIYETNYAGETARTEAVFWNRFLWKADLA